MTHKGWKLELTDGSGNVLDWSSKIVRADVDRNRHAFTSIDNKGVLERHPMWDDVGVDLEIDVDSSTNKLDQANRWFMDTNKLHALLQYDGVTVCESDGMIIGNLDVHASPSRFFYTISLYGTQSIGTQSHPTDSDGRALACYPEPQECPDCKGSGKYIGFSEVGECIRCQGTGQFKE